MKLEPLFYAKENKLFKIDDNSQFDCSSLKKFELPWSQIEFEEDKYNEECLAQLRDDLKKLEIHNEFAVIVPKVDKAFDSQEQKEAFINTFNHCARRIKDCISVAGFELAPELCAQGFAEDSISSDFMNTLAIKHAQYVYFVSQTSEVPGTIVKY